jgi:hypothetical protein
MWLTLFSVAMMAAIGLSAAAVVIQASSPGETLGK